MDHSQGDSGQPPVEEGGHWNDLVAEASEHVKERVEAMAAPSEPPPPSRARGTLLAFLTVALVGVIGWNIYFFAFSGKPSSVFEETALLASLFLAQQAVEEGWEETGSFPASLVVIGADEEELTFTPTETGYIITATGVYREVSFQRGDDIAPLEAAFQYLLSGEAKR